jgi:regulation of enolase protein 1 (concanavalin A-like superfamily)
MSPIVPKAVAAGLGPCVLACFLALPATADEKGAEVGPQIKRWGQAVDPDSDCEITPADGGVAIQVPGTAHDFAAELEKQNAPRVLSKVEGDFIAEVKVSGAFRPGATSRIPGRRPYHGAGLLLIKDKENYISLHRGCVYLDDKLRHYANFELRKDGELAISLYEIEIPDEDTYLRLERRGDRVFNATSADGVHWTSYEPITLELPGAVEFGIVGISSSEVPLSVRFRDLRVFRKVEVE